jgi:hypothetical protein
VPMIGSPVVERVSMNRGFSAESPNASRTRLMALYRPCSKSTKCLTARAVVAFRPSDYIAPALQQHLQDVQRLVLKLDSGSILAQFTGVASSSKTSNRIVLWERFRNGHTDPQEWEFITYSAGRSLATLPEIGKRAHKRRPAGLPRRLYCHIMAAYG